MFSASKYFGCLGVLLLAANVQAVELQSPVLKWGPITAGTGAGSAYYLNDAVTSETVIIPGISSGIYQQNKAGDIVNSLAVTDGAAAKSALTLGNYVYFTGTEGGIYRTQNWSTYSACTISNSLALETIATDGTQIFGSTTAAGNQVHGYAVDPSTGYLTISWSTSGITGRVRGLDWDASGYIYAVDGGGTTETDAGNTCHIYAINATSGVTTDMGAITYNGRAYQVVREGNQLAVFDSYTGSSAAAGQMYVYNLSSDTALSSTTPVSTWDPAGIGSIYGAAIDNGFMWLTSGGGTTYGYAVPEPGTFALVGIGLLTLIAYAWRKQQV